MIAAALGWIGTVGTITAYVMLMRGRMQSESITYATLNMVGGFLGASATAMYGAWSSCASNLIWALVAGHGLIATLRARSDWREVVDRMPYVTPIDEPEPTWSDDEPLDATMELPVQAA